MMATISPGTASPELGRRICLRMCVAGSTTCTRAPCQLHYFAMAHQLGSEY